MAVMASWVAGSVPMVLKRTRTRATCLSSLVEAGLGLLVAQVGDSTLSTTARGADAAVCLTQPGGEAGDEVGRLTFVGAAAGARVDHQHRAGGRDAVGEVLRRPIS